MHLLISATILSAALVAAQPFIIDPGRLVCASKNPQLAAAIDQFCSNSNIVVPSSYAAGGKTVGDNVAWIWPQGNCPEAWVPQKYCYSQFYEACARGDGKGYGTMSFGRPGEKKCQVWLLNTQRVHQQQIDWSNNGGPPSRVLDSISSSSPERFVKNLTHLTEYEARREATLPDPKNDPLALRISPIEFLPSETGAIAYLLTSTKYGLKCL